jgi:hypothetical protein
MKTLLRAVILLLVTLWVGGVLFFPVVAATAFSTLPDTHVAGTVVRLCLRTLHAEGLFSGALLVVLLLIAGALRAYERTVVGPVSATLAMLALTAFSQYSIMPRMEVDRLAVGGAIDAAPVNDPHRLDFNRLHVASTRVEGGVLVAGVLLIVMLSRPPLRTR